MEWTFYYDEYNLDFITSGENTIIGFFEGTKHYNIITYDKNDDRKLDLLYCEN
jgi:hypothetical protein